MRKYKKRLKRILMFWLGIALLLPDGAAAAESAVLPRDVSGDAWYAPYVQTCIDKGLMGVLENGNFEPDREVSAADLIVLTAQLWSAEIDEEESLDRVWYAEEELPLQDCSLKFTYSDAMTCIREKDNGSMRGIQEKLEKAGKPATEILATRGDLCQLLGGNMRSPVYLRGYSREAEELPTGAYNMYMAGIMVGTENGLELDRVLPRREAAAFLARYACPKLRMPDEPLCPYTQEDLTQVYLGFGSFGATFLEYKLDMESGKLWHYRMTEEDRDSDDFDLDTGRYRSMGRNPRAENEGYRLCAELSQTQMEELKDGGVLQNALTWKHYYKAAYSFDGLQWYFTFTFQNGDKWEVSGSNAFPEGWNVFYNTFDKMAGETD